jgi:hypothetical protein
MACTLWVLEVVALAWALSVVVWAVLAALLAVASTRRYIAPPARSPHRPQMATSGWGR